MKKNPQSVSRESMQAVGKGDTVTLNPFIVTDSNNRHSFFVVTCDPVELRRGLSIIADTEFVAMFSGIVEVSKNA